MLINSFSNNTRLPVTRSVTNTIKVYFLILSQLNSSDSTFLVKMTQFFLSVIERKNWVIETIRLSHWRNQNSTQPFRSKWLNFSFSVHREKKLSHFDLNKMSHFDPKSWFNSGNEKNWPNFLGQNDRIFRSVHREK